MWTRMTCLPEAAKSNSLPADVRIAPGVFNQTPGVFYRALPCPGLLHHSVYRNNEESNATIAKTVSQAEAGIQ
jgi:hypothetical protein